MNGHPWTPDELSTLRSLYPNIPTRDVAQALGRTIRSVYGAATNLGLAKTEEFLQSPESGRLKKGQSRAGSIATQFQPGQRPANKGLRRPGWAPGRMRETQFRKGQRSGSAADNWRPIGSVSADTEGYLRIKVREAVHGAEPTGYGNVNVWPLLQRHTWRQHHGAIPPSHVIAFKDGDRQNCAIENLECVSRAEMARRNAMWGRYPSELIHVIQLNGALKRKLRNKL